MKPDQRRALSTLTAERITGISASGWRDDDRATYYLVDEALVEAIQTSRSQVADWLESRGFFYLADDLRRGRDEVGA